MMRCSAAAGKTRFAADGIGGDGGVRVALAAAYAARRVFLLWYSSSVIALMIFSPAIMFISNSSLNICFICLCILFNV